MPENAVRKSARADVASPPGALMTKLFQQRLATVLQAPPKQHGHAPVPAVPPAGEVTVISGATFGPWPVAGKTVGYVRRQLAALYNIHPQAKAVVNGQIVLDGAVLIAGDELEFVKGSGEKGAIDGPVYTVKEASALYFQGKVSSREVNALFNAGELKGCRVGRKILIYKWSLDEYTTRTENFGRCQAPLGGSLPEEPEPGTPARKGRGRSGGSGFQVFHLP